MQLPATIKIGAHDINCVEGRSALTHGEYDMCSTITVSSNQLPSQMVETVIHEVIHVINANAKLLQHQDDETLEEQVTTVIAYGLTQVFRDNPQVVGMLTALTQKNDKKIKKP